MSCFNYCSNKTNELNTQQTTPYEVINKFQALKKDTTASTNYNQNKKKLSVRKSLYDKNHQEKDMSSIRPRIQSTKQDLGEQDYKQLKYLVGSLSSRNNHF